jgi:FtsP/CotA-like multicopper oxidase with cupredoxin domain
MGHKKTLFLVLLFSTAAAQKAPPSRSDQAAIRAGSIKRTRPPSAPRPYRGRIRSYFIAAEPVEWNYAPRGRDQVAELGLPKPWQTSQKYAKYRYVQYTDDSFKVPVPQPEWLGILGPTIRGVVGDTLSVTFLNRSGQPNLVFSIHPHGVRYDKNSEGAYNLYPKPGLGSWIASSQKYTYIWKVDEEAGPAPGEPSSKVWLYHSHVAADSDINRGLVGAIVITDPAHAREDATPSDVDREFVTLFLIFNENGDIESMDGDDDDTSPAVRARKQEFHNMSPDAQREMLEGGLKHTMNGYMFGNLPALDMNEGERVRWYVVALGSEQDLHVAHWHGKTVLEEGRRRTDDVELLPGSMKVADMKADNPGTWMFHCHVADHMMGGMYAYYTIHAANEKRNPTGGR